MHNREEAIKRRLERHDRLFGRFKDPVKGYITSSEFIDDVTMDRTSFTFSAQRSWCNGILKRINATDDQAVLLLMISWCKSHEPFRSNGWGFKSIIREKIDEMSEIIIKLME